MKKSFPALQNSVSGRQFKMLLLASAVAAVFHTDFISAAPVEYNPNYTPSSTTENAQVTDKKQAVTDGEYTYAYAAWADARSQSGGDAKANNIEFTITNSTMSDSTISAYTRSAGGAAEANNNSLTILGGSGKNTATAWIQGYRGTLLGNNNKFEGNNTSRLQTYASSFQFHHENTSYEAIHGSDNTLTLHDSSIEVHVIASGAVVRKNNIKITDVEMNRNSVDIDTTDVGTYISASAIDHGSSNLQIGSITSNENSVKASAINAESIYTANFSNQAGTSKDPVSIQSVEMKSNTLEISDSNVTKGIGAALVQKKSGLSYDNITNNTVRIKNVTVGENGIYAAAAYDRLNNVDTFYGIDQGNSIFAEGINKAGTIGGFERLNLIVGNQNYSSLTEGVQGSKAVITLTGDNHNVDLSNRTLSLGAASGFSMPKDGYFNLIHVEGNSTLIVPEKSKITFEDTFKATSWEVVGGPLNYKQGETFALSFEYNPQTPVDPVDPETPPPLTPSEQKATGNATTLARASLGAASLIGIGLEYIADEGINMMTDAAYHDGNNVFAAVYGSTNDYKGHADFDLDSSTAIVGVSTKKNNAVVSAFFEASDGNFSSDLSSAHTSADMQAYDVGTAVRFMADNPFYIDASFRLGVVKTDFDGHFSTESVSYNSDRVFQSLHGALGYDLELSDALSLDNYARYSFIHIEDDDIKLHDKSGTDLQLDDVNSQAFRIGSRLKGYFGDNRLGSFRVGLAYEKVFEGKADAKVDGLKVNAPDLKGDIGILEIGIAKRPTADSPWGVDLTAKGYGGDREGLYGSATLNYVFF